MCWCRLRNPEIPPNPSGFSVFSLTSDLLSAQGTTPLPGPPQRAQLEHVGCGHSLPSSAEDETVEPRLRRKALEEPTIDNNQRRAFDLKCLGGGRIGLQFLSYDRAFQAALELVQVANAHSPREFSPPD